jgi:chromosome segregation ATPase
MIVHLHERRLLLKKLEGDIRQLHDELGDEHGEWLENQVRITELEAALSNAEGNWKQYREANEQALERVAKLELELDACSESRLASLIYIKEQKAQNAELRAALELRQAKGHHDTCAYELSPSYPCSCGFDEAAAVLAKGTP